MAARPLSCSEKLVKPCGTFSIFGLSAIMTTDAERRAGAIAAERRETKEVLAIGAVERARTGVIETKAIVSEVVWVRVNLRRKNTGGSEGSGEG